MPSLHIAWAVWCTLAVWQISRSWWLRSLAVLYPCVTALAVLATGNHFVLDLVGGLLAIAAAAALVRIATSLRLSGPLGATLKAQVGPRGACHKLVTKSKIR